jgi:hypothetical protein
MWIQNIYYLQKIEEEVNNHVRSGLERQLAKKRLNVCIGGAYWFIPTLAMDYMKEESKDH